MRKGLHSGVARTGVARARVVVGSFNLYVIC